MADSQPTFRRFDAAEACYELALAVFQVTKSWPVEERFGLTSQVRRAAFSSVANIVEGAAKKGPKEFRRYLDISLGSLSELELGLSFSKDCGILNIADWERLSPLLARAGQLTGGLARAMRRKAELSSRQSVLGPRRRTAEPPNRLP